MLVFFVDFFFNTPRVSQVFYKSLGFFCFMNYYNNGVGKKIIVSYNSIDLSHYNVFEIVHWPSEIPFYGTFQNESCTFEFHS